MPRTPKPTDHLDAFRHLMGTQPDHEIAKLCDSTPSIVGRYRRKYKIPAYEGYKFGLGQEPPSKKASSDEGGGSDDAPKVVAQSSKAKGKGSGRSKLDAHRDIIGVLSDAEVAGRAGVTPEAVRVYRQRHDIPSKRSVAASAPSAAKASAVEDDKKVAQRRSSKLDHYMDLVGTLPDREVATMAGVTPENVRAFRRRHDIPARWRDEGDEGGEVAAVAAAPVEAAAEAAPAEAAPVEAVAEAPAVEAPAVEVAPAAAARASRSRPTKAARPSKGVSEPAAEVATEVAAEVAPVIEAEPALPAVPSRASNGHGLNGYIVHVRQGGETREYLIVSTDIASAANNALSSVAARLGSCEIMAIRHLGPALS